MNKIELQRNLAFATSDLRHSIERNKLNVTRIKRLEALLKKHKSGKASLREDLSRVASDLDDYKLWDRSHRDKINQLESRVKHRDTDISLKESQYDRVSRQCDDAYDRINSLEKELTRANKALARFVTNTLVANS